VAVAVVNVAGVEALVTVKALSVALPPPALVRVGVTVVAVADAVTTTAQVALAAAPVAKTQVPAVVWVTPVVKVPAAKVTALPVPTAKDAMMVIARSVTAVLPRAMVRVLAFETAEAAAVKVPEAV